jgi:hypothetical protein
MLGNIQIDHRTAELHILIIVHFNLFPFRANRISWIVCRAKVSEKIDQTIFEISPSKNRRSTHSNSEHNKHLFRKNHKKSALVKQQPQRERERERLLPKQNWFHQLNALKEIWEPWKCNILKTETVATSKYTTELYIQIDNSAFQFLPI